MAGKNLQSIRIIFLLAVLLSVFATLAFCHDVSIGTGRNAISNLPYEKMDSYASEFSSHLPIMVLQTSVDLLPNRDVPTGSVIWYFDSCGENRLTDNPATVFRHATANYRGAVSLTFPQKPYKLSLYNDASGFFEPLYHSFFGLSPLSEWVLRPPYADKSLLRDWYAYELAATVLNWQPRGGMVQVFLQDGPSGMIEYQGVYFLSQYIPAAVDNELNLGTFSLSSSEKIDFDGGGYLYQRDRATEYSNFMFSFDNTVYRVMHPGRSEATSVQVAFLEEEISFFHNLLTRSGEYEFISNDDWDYESYIDVDSFINYFLVAELIKCLDAGLFSTYMYRPAGGKLVMGPLWDCDWSLGNQINAANFAYFSVFRAPLISTLIRDEVFFNKVVQAWDEYRSSIWSDDKLFGLFDAMAEHLKEPAAQNALRWPRLYSGNTHIERARSQPFTNSWEEEIEVTRSWLEKRLAWLDESIPKLINESVMEINSSYRESLQNTPDEHEDDPDIDD